MLLTSSAEMSRAKQFHMSRPKRNFFKNNSFHTTFFKTRLIYVIRCIIKLFNNVSH